MEKIYTIGVLENNNQKVIITGWVNNIRDHGGVYFIDLRDSQGMVQLVANPTTLSKEEYEKFHSLRDEWVIEIKGEVRNRGEGLINPNLATGGLEVVVEDLIILSKAKTLPFKPGDKTVNEELRLKYRYLDLRDKELQKTLKKRSKIALSNRVILDVMGYSEIETPLLIKSSEGGAEEIYATSKLFPSEFYSLPQSPQMYKQMLMVGGVEKYYSFAKCFRAESGRSDRNIEFTQIDMERSFVGREEIIKDVENVFFSSVKTAVPLGFKMENLSKFLTKIDVPYDFGDGSGDIIRISYDSAMENFGSDKPDLRCEMPLMCVKDLFKDTSFEVFSKIAKDRDSRLKAIVAKNVDNPDKLSRKKIKELEKFVMDFGAKGLAYFQCKDEDGEVSLKGPLTKMLSAKELTNILETCKLEVGDIIFFGAGEKESVLDYMGRLRLKIATDLDLLTKTNNVLWVTDFPMFEKTSDGGIKSKHHPFTAPITESWLSFKDNKLGLIDILSDSYDLVLNGVELGGGSVRIHDQGLQKEVFELMEVSKEDIESKFGYFMEALSYGTPPHAGFAFGFDRLVTLLLGKDNIREVIAFPKTQSGTCSMTQSPNEPNENQMREMGIRKSGLKNKTAKGE